MQKVIALLLLGVVVAVNCNVLPYQYFSRKAPFPGVVFEKAYITTDEDGNSRFRRGMALVDGTIKGAYGLLNKDGSGRVVFYRSDAEGARYVVKTNEAGTSPGEDTADTKYRSLKSNDYAAVTDMNRNFEQLFDANFA